MNNKDFNQETKRKDRHGINNPMFGRTHSPQSREKMSQAATLRNQQYKQWKDSQAHLTMSEFLGSQPMREYICSLIREEISKLL